MSFALLVPAPLRRDASRDERRARAGVVARISAVAQGLPEFVEHQPTIAKVATILRSAEQAVASW